MSNTLKFKVHNCRPGGQHSVMGCDLAVGYEANGTFVGVLDCRGLWLKRKKDGSGYFVSFPAKQRMDKNGQPAMKNGYPVYDNYIDLYMEEGANPEKPDVRGITEAAWNFRGWLINEMVKASEQLDAPQAGRGPSRPAAGARPGTRPAPRSAPPAPAAASAPRAARPTPKPAPVPVEYDETPDDDDGFPF